MFEESLKWSFGDRFKPLHTLSIYTIHNIWFGDRFKPLHTLSLYKPYTIFGLEIDSMNEFTKQMIKCTKGIET